jgi:hypothetical protein
MTLSGQINAALAAHRIPSIMQLAAIAETFAAARSGQVA